jgi:GTP-binding protein HflX
VGFIKDLPHELVASFRATLESARDADFLLHLVDASDPDHDKQVEVTRTILDSLEIPPQRILRVFNKMDRVSPEDAAILAERHPGALFMSTKLDADVVRARAAIMEAFERHMSRETFFVPYAHHALVAELHATCRVLEEQHEDEGTRLTVLGLPQALAPMRAALERLESKLS